MPDGSTERSQRGSPRDLVVARVVTFGTVAVAFPLASVAVFGFGTDRVVTADVLSVVYSVGIALAISTSFWPLPGLRGWSRAARTESLAITFLGMSYATHLSWELVWVLFHDTIARSANAPWAYPWWAYIDGGDARYAEAPPTLIALELLSVSNGLVGAGALRKYLGSGRRDRSSVLVLAGTAVVHLYSASFYYLGEIVAGLPSVDTTRFVATWFKFVLANAPWVVAPFFVFAWARAKLVSGTVSPE